MTETTKVACSCPTCGKLVESNLLGNGNLVDRMSTDMLTEHKSCDLQACYRALSATALALRPFLFPIVRP